METYNQTAFPPLGIYDRDPMNLKGEHDVYDVYVNKEDIGKQLVITENDEIDGLVDFLKLQGLNNINTTITGANYIIQTEDEERVKAVIDAYIKNR